MIYTEQQAPLSAIVKGKEPVLTRARANFVRVRPARDRHMARQKNRQALRTLTGANRDVTAGTALMFVSTTIRELSSMANEKQVRPCWTTTAVFEKRDRCAPLERDSCLSPVRGGIWVTPDIIEHP